MASSVYRGSETPPAATDEGYESPNGLKQDRIEHISKVLKKGAEDLSKLSGHIVEKTSIPATTTIIDAYLKDLGDIKREIEHVLTVQKAAQ